MAFRIKHVTVNKGRFSARRFSQARKRRLLEARKIFRRKHRLGFGLSALRFKSIFFTAENLIRMSDKSIVFVFVGQGMRPLFESVRALNEKDKKLSNRRLLYVVNPEFSPESARHALVKMDKTSLRGSAEGGRAIDDYRANLVKQRLLKSGRPIRTAQKVFVVDFRQSEFSIGSNMKNVERAVLSINPNAKIIELTQSKDGFGGIFDADGIEHPSIKDYDGRLSANPDKRIRDEYLLFQRELQKYLKRRNKQ